MHIQQVPDDLLAYTFSWLTDSTYTHTCKAFQRLSTDVRCIKAMHVDLKIHNQSLRWRTDTIAGLPAVHAHSICVSGGHLYIWAGGQSCESIRGSNNLWHVDLRQKVCTLIQPSDPEALPPPATFAPMIRYGNCLLTFGGQELVSGNNWLFYNTLHVFDLNCRSWAQVECTLKPSQRTGHRLIKISNERAVLFGGMFVEQDHYQYYDDWWVLDLNKQQWSAVEFSGELPCARHSHDMICLPDTSLVFLFGGNKDWPNSVNLNDAYLLDFETMQSTQLTCVDAPSPRICVSLATLSSYIVLYGGYRRNSPESLMSTLYYCNWKDVSNTKVVRWHSCEIQGEVSERIFSSCDSTEDGLVLVGGLHGYQPLSDLLWLS